MLLLPPSIVSDVSQSELTARQDVRIQNELASPFFNKNLTLANAGDSQGLYCVCLYMLLHPDSLETFKDISGISHESLKQRALVVGYDATAIEEIAVDIDGKTEDESRRYYLPQGLDKQEERIKNVLLSIQKAAKNGVQEACAFLQRISRNLEYLESGSFFSRLYDLLALKEEKKFRRGLIKALKKLQDSELENTKVTEIIEIFLKTQTDVKFSTRQQMKEDIQKDLMWKTFYWWTPVIFYSVATLFPLVSICILAGQISSCRNSTTPTSPMPSTYNNLTLAGMTLALAQILMSSPANSDPCANEIIWYTRFFTPISVLGVALYTAYNAFRAYMQSCSSDYETSRQAEILSTALIILDKPYKTFRIPTSLDKLSKKIEEENAEEEE